MYGGRTNHLTNLIQNQNFNFGRNTICSECVWNFVDLVANFMFTISNFEFWCFQMPSLVSKFYSTESNVVVRHYRRRFNSRQTNFLGTGSVTCKQIYEKWWNYDELDWFLHKNWKKWCQKRDFESGHWLEIFYWFAPTCKNLMLSDNQPPSCRIDQDST